MAGFSKAERQKIIDDYLAESGKNAFHPGEFIDWLQDRPDHVAHPWFFSKDDAEAAREYRIALARGMASGLRIVARVDEGGSTPRSLSVSVREFPAMISPVAGRKAGGGYVAYEPEDADLSAELRRQGAQSLRSWIMRYRGVCEQGGLDVSPIEEIAASLDGSVVRAA